MTIERPRGRSTRTACGRSARGGWKGGDFFVSRCKAARGGGKKLPTGRCGKAIGAQPVPFGQIRSSKDATGRLGRDRRQKTRRSDTPHNKSAALAPYRPHARRRYRFYHWASVSDVAGAAMVTRLSLHSWIGDPVIGTAIGLRNRRNALPTWQS